MKHILFITTFLFILNCESTFENEQEIIPGQLWVEVASAEQQCIPPDYASLEDAVHQLERNSVVVHDSTIQSYAVCLACSCPTGIVYQAEIDSTHLNKALNLGWLPAQDNSE